MSHISRQEAQPGATCHLAAVAVANIFTLLQSLSPARLRDAARIK